MNEFQDKLIEWCMNELKKDNEGLTKVEIKWVAVHKQKKVYNPLITGHTSSHISCDEEYWINVEEGIYYILNVWFKVLADLTDDFAVMIPINKFGEIDNSKIKLRIGIKTGNNGDFISQIAKNLKQPVLFQSFLRGIDIRVTQNNISQIYFDFEMSSKDMTSISKTKEIDTNAHAVLFDTLARMKREAELFHTKEIYIHCPDGKISTKHVTKITKFRVPHTL